MTLRNNAPQLEPIKHVAMAVPHIFDITPNVRLLWMKEVANETCRLDLHFDAGYIRGGDSLPEIVKSLLLSGTTEQSSVQINEAIDALGGYLDVEMGAENAVVSIYCLRTYLFDIAKMVFDAIQNCAFREDEVNDILRSLEQNVKVNAQKVKTVAGREFRKHLFASESSYAWFSDISHFSTPTIGAYKRFWKENYLEGLTRMTLVGNVEQDTVDALIDLFGKWSKASNPTFLGGFTTEAKRLHFPIEDAVQTAVRLGKFTITKDNDDIHGLAILNTILGGYFGSRLMSNIREDKGYTYGIGSGLAEYHKVGYFAVVTEVAKEVLDETLNEIEKEIKRLQTELIPEEELTLVKNYLLGQFLRAADGPYAMLDLYNGVDMYGLGLDYYDRSIREINEITPEKLLQLANDYLKWEEMVIVTAG